MCRSVCGSVSDTGSERRRSGELNSIPAPGALSLSVSPPQPLLGRGRPDNNKVGAIPPPEIGLLPQPLPGSSLGSPRCLLPKTENRRITHISAEQKRRFNIKLGFDTLHGLVSTLSAQPSLKVSPQPRGPFLDGSPSQTRSQGPPDTGGTASSSEAHTAGARR